jgi:hypothetical protein
MDEPGMWYLSRGTMNTVVCFPFISLYFFFFESKIRAALRALMLMIDGFFSVTNVQSFLLACLRFVHVLYKIRLFCDIDSLNWTGRLRIMDWEAAGGQGPGRFLGISTLMCMHGYVARDGKRPLLS